MIPSFMNYCSKHERYWFMTVLKVLVDIVEWKANLIYWSAIFWINTLQKLKYLSEWNQSGKVQKRHIKHPIRDRSFASLCKIYVSEDGENFEVVSLHQVTMNRWIQCKKLISPWVIQISIGYVVLILELH